MTKTQLTVIIGAVALLSAGVGVVLSSHLELREARISVDVGPKAGSAEQTEQLAKVTAEAAAAEDRLSIYQNEQAALKLLRDIGRGQDLVQSMALIDTDGDLGGEFGYLAELAGTSPLRTATGLGNPMDPALFNPALGRISPLGHLRLNGYIFQVYLPGPLVGDKITGIAEAGGGGAAFGEPFPDSSNAEILWCAYAWPIETGETGRRVFFLNYEGEVLETANTDGRYGGPARWPTFDAALSSESPDDMMAPLATDSSAPANDGQKWTAMGS